MKIKKLYMLISIISFGLLIFPSGKIEAQTNLENGVVAKVYENRKFQVKGKDTVTKYSQMQSRTPWSRYESTGIYVNEGQTINLAVSSKSKKIKAYIQSYAMYNSSNSWDEKEYKLQHGENKITSNKKGILYLSNEESTGSTEVIVTGGNHIPVFEKFCHNKTDLVNMLKKYSDAPYVEYVSERGLITVTYESITNYMKQPNATDPVKLVENLDKFLMAQDTTAGYDNTESVHKQDTHYRHLIQDTKSGMFMYSTSYRTAYVSNAIEAVLNGFEVGDSWGPFHENGHQQQSIAMNFHNMSEVQVNVFSLAAQKAMGYKTTALEDRKIYPKIEKYLNLSSEEKNYDDIKDLFVKLGMLHQLTLSFGDQFYPNLYRLYREVPLNELPAEFERDQFFIIMSSKVAGYDLSPFFEMWGMEIRNYTKIEIEKLNLVPLTQEIWRGTDAEPVRVPLLKIKSNTLDLMVSDEIYKGSNRIIVYHNGDYAFETYQGHTYYASEKQSGYKQTTLSKEIKNVKYGDKFEVYQSEGVPGNPLINEKLLVDQLYTGDISIDVTPSGFTSSMDSGLFNSKTRIVFLHNGNYAGESYDGGIYYMGLSNNGEKVNLTQDISLAPNDKIDAYIVPGKPGDAMDNSTKMKTNILLSSIPEDGSTFSYSFLGLGEKIFANIDISLKEKQATINTIKGDPHWYFEGKKYASIFVQDKNGAKKYSKEYMGRTNYPESQEKVEFILGDYITVYHAEFVKRLNIKNQENGKNLPIKETITYQVTEKGLKVVETNTIPK